jgi:hypothetical protein
MEGAFEGFGTNLRRIERTILRTFKTTRKRLYGGFIFLTIAVGMPLWALYETDHGYKHGGALLVTAGALLIGFYAVALVFGVPDDGDDYLIHPLYNDD